MHMSKLRLTVGAVVMAVGFTGLGAGTAYAFQGHMFSARDDLQQSLNELQVAVPDKGGHRENAINLVRQAIGEVNLGIQFGAQ